MPSTVAPLQVADGRDGGEDQPDGLREPHRRRVLPLARRAEARREQRPVQRAVGRPAHPDDHRDREHDGLQRSEHPAAGEQHDGQDHGRDGGGEAHAPRVELLGHRVSSRARACCRSARRGTPPTRRSSVPARSNATVVGVRRTWRACAIPGFSATSTSTWRRSGCSAVSAVSCSRVRAHGVQTGDESWSRRTRSPGPGSSPARSQPCSVSLPSVTRPFRRRRTSPTTVATTRTPTSTAAPAALRPTSPATSSTPTVVPGVALLGDESRAHRGIRHRGPTV